MDDRPPLSFSSERALRPPPPATGAPNPVPWAAVRGGGPAVVLLHGLADTHTLWRHQVPVLQQQFLTIAIDHYGHGRTPLPPGILTTTVMADGVAALIERMAVAPAVVVGLSMGGGVAQVLALRRPELVRALVLVSTGSDFPPATRARFLERAALAEREGMAAVVDATVGRWFSARFARLRREEVEFTRATVLANDRTSFAAASRANADRSWSDRLAEIGCPVLFVGGEQDPADPLRSLATYRERVRDLTVELIPGVSHLVPVEAADRFTEVLVDFIERVAAGD